MHQIGCLATAAPAPGTVPNSLTSRCALTRFGGINKHASAVFMTAARSKPLCGHLSMYYTHMLPGACCRATSPRPVGGVCSSPCRSPWGFAAPASVPRCCRSRCGRPLRPKSQPLWVALHVRSNFQRHISQVCVCVGVCKCVVVVCVVCVRSSIFFTCFFRSFLRFFREVKMLNLCVLINHIWFCIVCKILLA